MSLYNSFFLETIKTINLIDKITLDKICDTILELKKKMVEYSSLA